MRVALTGATGFIGRYIAAHLAEQGHALRCWHRPSSNREGFDQISDIQWIEGDLGDRCCVLGDDQRFLDVAEGAVVLHDIPRHQNFNPNC